MNTPIGARKMLRFLDLLSEATKGNPNFHLIATMTEMDERIANGKAKPD